jgi:ABC-2 type transport system permease protein
MTITFSRQRGLLKRIRGTPLPSWIFLFGRIGNSILVSIILVLIIVISGALFYNVTIPINNLPALLITLIIGAATFSSLGIAITTIISNEDAAPAIVNASILPLLFISDIFIPMHEAPNWLNTITHIFPVKPFSAALQTAFNPFEVSSGFELINIGIIIIWLIIGLLVSIRYFSWEPRD